jgi:hypothetical protein
LKPNTTFPRCVSSSEARKLFPAAAIFPDALATSADGSAPPAMIQEAPPFMDIRAGMTAQVDILAMRRSILSYIVNPVSKLFSQAMKDVFSA